MSKVEIMPPARNQQMTTFSPPSIHAGGAIKSYFQRNQLDRDTRTTDAMTRRVQAITSLLQSRGAVLDECATYTRKYYALRELTETLAHELAYRREERSERLRELSHTHHLAYIKRETKSNIAMIALVDAQQQLNAHREYGHSTYEIKWALERAKLLDMELDTEQKRELLRRHRTAAGGNNGRGGDDDETRTLLNEYRAQLAQNNLDTSRIDSILKRQR